jgi:hypothetical protein
MITRIIITFLIFAGIAYYYDIDVRTVVDRSGVPAWLAEHGITAKATTTLADAP